MAISFQGAVLYKKTSTGKIQYWKIFSRMNEIVTRYGQDGGKEQETVDLIKEGKNSGRSNSTTPEQQAYAEAEARWIKQLKKGYVKTIAEAEAGAVDSVIAGGVNPMLAHKFSEQGHKIKFPALAQPKFDGHRCLAVVSNGKATLWSRTRKPITGVPHIVQIIESLVKMSGHKDIVFDGELYAHNYSKNFEELSSFIRQVDPKPGHEVVEYHIYDLAGGVDGTGIKVADLHQGARIGELNRIFNSTLVEEYRHNGGGHKYGHLMLVETIQVDDEDDMMAAFERFLAQGYEGLMVRNAMGAYVGKRSSDLQKVKEFDDQEFLVTGIEEGRGKLAGHAIFICQAANGTSFRVKMKGETSDLKHYFENPDLAIGRLLTVKYQGITNKSLVPRFPIGVRFKEDI